MAYEVEIAELLKDPDYTEIGEFLIEMPNTGDEESRYWESLGSFVTHYWRYDGDLAKAVLKEAIEELKNIRDNYEIVKTPKKVVIEEREELVYKR